MTDECFPVRKLDPSIPREPLRLMSKEQELLQSRTVSFSSHHCLQSPGARRTNGGGESHKLQFKNQCSDVLINLGSHERFFRPFFFVILYLTIF